MKYLQRYLSLLFALLMSLTLFLIPVNAESTSKYDIFSISHLRFGNGQSIDNWIWQYPVDQYSDYDLEIYMPNVTYGDYISTTYHFSMADGTSLLKANLPAKVSINNVYQHYRFMTTGNSVINRTAVTYTFKEINVFYTDGTSEVIDSFESGYVSGTESTTFTFNITPEKDIRKITLNTNYQLAGDGGFTGELLGFQASAYNSSSLGIDLTVESQETGWLKQIFNKITNLWQTCEAGFANLVKGITELPQKIGDAIKGLFVPTEESMTEIKDKWDELLSDRFGALYEVIDILHNSWESIMNNTEGYGLIDFPEATIDLPGGESFTFGGWTVSIIPGEQFMWMVEGVQMVISVIATMAFINALRKRYDEVMGVEK